MVNVPYRLQADGRQRDPAYSVLDLKADCRSYKYVEETIKMLPGKPEPVLLNLSRSPPAVEPEILARRPRPVPDL